MSSLIRARLRFCGLKALLCLILLALLFAGASASAKRIGPDIEDFNPPYSTDDPLVVQALAAYDAENDREAERLARQLVARAVARKARGALAQIEARFILARALEGQRRLTEAESEYRQGLALIGPLVAAESGKKAKPADEARARQWVRFFELLLQSNLSGQGRFREADMLPSLLPPDPASADEPKAERAGVGWMPGIKTTPCWGRGLDIRALDTAETEKRGEWDSAADAHFAANDPAGAETVLRQMVALDIQSFGAAHCETIVDRRRLAQALLEQGRLGEAEGEARQLLATIDGQGQGYGQTVYVLGLLAQSVAGQRGAAEAEPYLRRALDILEQGKGADSDEALSARLDLAANLYAQARLKESEELYRKSLATLQASWFGNQALALDIQEFSGYLARRQGRIADAVKDYRAVCARRAELSAQSGRGSMASLVKTLDRTDSGSCALRYALALREWAERGGGADAADRPDALRAEAFEVAQSALPSPSADTLARAAARVVAASSGAGDLAERYEAAIRKRDEAGYAPKPLWRDPRADWTLSAQQREEQEKLNQSIAEIATQLAKDAPLYWDMRMPRPTDVAALQGPDGALLRKDEALVFLMVPPGNGEGLVFAVSRDRIGWDRIGMSGDDLRRDVAALRGDIDSMAYGLPEDIRKQGPGYAPFDRALAYRLYQALLGGAEIQSVIGDRKTLIMVPTGPLTTLPPGLLVASPPQGGADADEDPAAMRRTDWLLRRKAIALLPSVASLRLIRQLTPRKRGAAPDPLLAFTNPDFSGNGAISDDKRPAGKRRAPSNYVSYFRNGRPFADALRDLPPLPHTWDEGMALATALGASPKAVLAGPGASKAELMRRNADGRLARTRILEFATHGLVAGEGDGMVEPALVLSAGATPEDWLLTASDAAGLRLNADWVLLSACNTGSPDLQEAEGLSGLVRAFFYAGSSALLVSHWTISDDLSAKLVPMTIRLDQGRGGLSKADALRRASLSILDDKRRDQTHPVYWAPFTLIGDPQ